MRTPDRTLFGRNRVIYLQSKKSISQKDLAARHGLSPGRVRELVNHFKKWGRFA